jgi:hypothetical protein
MGTASPMASDELNRVLALIAEYGRAEYVDGSPQHRGDAGAQGTNVHRAVGRHQGCPWRDGGATSSALIAKCCATMHWPTIY